MFDLLHSRDAIWKKKDDNSSRLSTLDFSLSHNEQHAHADRRQTKNKEKEGLLSRLLMIFFFFTLFGSFPRLFFHVICRIQPN